MSESKITPLPGDMYLHLSALQKSIRRGEIETALRASLSIWQNDRQRLKRRLLVIAFEDLGIASPELLIKSASLSEWEETADLVRLLCGAVKNRLADSVCIQVEHSPEYRPLREQLTEASDATVILERNSLSAGRNPFVWDIHGEEVTYDLEEPQGVRNPTTLWTVYQTALAQARQIISQSDSTLPAYAAACKMTAALHEFF